MSHSKINRLITTAIFVLFTGLLPACNKKASSGERTGVVTEFSRTKLVWKSHDGRMHTKQTGMDLTIDGVQLSIVANRQNPELVSLIDSAVQNGWKVKLAYQKNSRDVSHVITDIQVIHKHPAINVLKKDAMSHGHSTDTAYMIIERSK